MKRCCVCNLEKDLDEFYARTKSLDGKQPRCKACHKEFKKKWEAANRDKKREYDRKSWTKHRDKRIQQSTQWRENNKERKKLIDSLWAKNNRDKANENNRRWASKNKDYRRANCAKRRAQKLKATVSWSNDFFIQEAYSLAALRTSLFNFEWEVDHIVPLRNPAVCGLHCEANLQVIPQKDNGSKGNRWWPDMWI